MWKLVQADDGTLTADDLLLLSVMLADAIRRAERHPSDGAARERELWLKLQPALRQAQGWTPRSDDAVDGRPSAGQSTEST